MPLLWFIVGGGLGWLLHGVAGQPAPTPQPGRTPRLAGVRPSFGKLTIDEMEALLIGVMAVDMQQLVDGYKPIDQALHGGQLVYIGRDDNEHVRTIREIWEYGGGDCEDLACAVAAYLTLKGPDRWVPHLYQARPGLYHAVVRNTRTNELQDPSLTGGM